MRTFITAIVGILLSSSMAHAQACPGYSVRLDQMQGDIYDPAGVLDTRVIIQLSVDGGDAPAECAQLPAVISSGSVAEPVATAFRNPDSLQDLTGNYPGNQDASLAGLRLELSLGARQRLVAGESVALNIVDLSAGQFRRGGSYTSLIQAQIGEGAPVSFNLTSDVVPVMQLLASSADGQETITLGDPTNGATGTTTFHFRSNTGVRVSASSLNNGHLRHEGGTGHTIPYTMRIAGTPVNLSPGPGALDLSFTNVMERASLIEVSILPRPANDMPYAGIYRDTVTLSFTPF